MNKTTEPLYLNIKYTRWRERANLRTISDIAPVTLLSYAFRSSVRNVVLLFSDWLNAQPDKTSVFILKKKNVEMKSEMIPCVDTKSVVTYHKTRKSKMAAVS